MNPVQDILEYGKHYWIAYTDEPLTYTGLLSTEEREFMSKQANSSNSDIVAACQNRLNRELEFFYAVHYQLKSSLQAWTAIIAEKERYDTVGWQAGTTDFTQALHTCLYIIPKRSNMGLLGPFDGVQGIGAEDGLSSNSGSIPIAYNNQSVSVEYNGSDDLPDYEESPRATEFEDWAGLDVLSSIEEDDQRAGDREEDQQSDASNDKEEDNQLVHESRSAPQKSFKDDFSFLDPWNTFLSNLEPFSGSTAPKRLVEVSESGVENSESKRRRLDRE